MTAMDGGNALARAIQKRVRLICARGGNVLDCATVRSDMALGIDENEIAIPEGDYVALCGVGTLAPGDRVVVAFFGENAVVLGRMEDT